MTDDIATLADIEDGTDATDAIQTVAGISANVTTVAGVSSNVTTVAGISADVTSVAGDATDIGTVAGSISNVNTVAGIDSDVTTVAGISANVTTVAGDSTDIQSLAAVTTEIGRLGTADAVADLNTLATSAIVADMDALADITADIDALGDIATDIQTLADIEDGTDATDAIQDVAGIASDVTTVAGISANVTTVAGVSANVTTVAGISSDVSTVAGDSADIQTVADDSADIATVAGISANVTTVAGISANVTTVAGDTTNIATVAGDTTNIGTVATNISNVNSVGGSIANVNTVASNISDVNSFADTYFISATAPSSPTVGDLWFDTTNDVMKVYSSGGFINAGSAVNGTSERQDYVVGTAEGSYTGSTTVFPATYDAGFVDVYLNGVKLMPEDFTATNGTSITLGSAAQTSDTVSIVAYGTFELSNFSIGDANNVDLTGLADDQILRYNSTTSNFEAEDLPTGIPDQSTHSGKFLTTDGSTASWATVNTDVSGDTTPQLGGDLDTNNQNINFGDNDKAQFGAGNDLQIYHDGVNSVVGDVNAGNLVLNSNGSEVAIMKAGTEYMGKFSTDGAVELYHDNSKKFETTSTGVDVTGTITTDGFDYRSGSNQTLIIGNSGSYAGGEYGRVMFKEGSTELAYLQWNGTGNEFKLINGINGPLTLGTNNTERLKINGDGSWGKAPAGTVIQVVRSQSNTLSTIAMVDGSNYWYDYPNLSATITPKSTSSKIIIHFRYFIESNLNDEHRIGFAIKRNTTRINLGQSSGSRRAISFQPAIGYDGDVDSTPVSGVMTTYDEPATTSAITYKPQMSVADDLTCAINRTVTDANSRHYERGTSEMIIMEIAG